MSIPGGSKGYSRVSGYTSESPFLLQSDDVQRQMDRFGASHGQVEHDFVISHVLAA